MYKYCKIYCVGMNVLNAVKCMHYILKNILIQLNWPKIVPFVMLTVCYEKRPETLQSLNKKALT